VYENASLAVPLSSIKVKWYEFGGGGGCCGLVIRALTIEVRSSGFDISNGQVLFYTFSLNA